MTYRDLRSTAAAACGALLLAACTDTAVTQGAGSQDLAAALVGTTLVSERGDVVTFTDGEFTGTAPSGTPFAGVWEIEDGLYCREVTEPSNAPRADRRCQVLTVDGDAFTFDEVGSDRVGTWMRQS